MTFSITILGSSSALPTPSRFSTAQALNVLERFFLIDCGEGTQIQLTKFKVRTSRINHIFISHLHGDHYLGIFGLISSLNLLGRKLPLFIHGPFKLKALIDAFLTTMDKGINFEIIYKPLHYDGIETIFEDDKLTVESFPLRHRVPTCGFLFKEKPRLRNLKANVVKDYNISIKEIPMIKQGADFIDTDGKTVLNKYLTHDPAPARSYAFVSDTSKFQKIVPYIAKVNLLYHEATYLHKDKKRAKETGHSTALQAAEIAKLAEADNLLLGHFSNRYKNLELLKQEAQTVFENTDIATDGKVFSIPLRNNK